jgi:hypothetical protein
MYTVEELIHLTRVVAGLSDRRLTEANATNVGEGQRHRLTSGPPLWLS